jgi:hypothetical protein
LHRRIRIAIAIIDINIIRHVGVHAASYEACGIVSDRLMSLKRLLVRSYMLRSQWLSQMNLILPVAWFRTNALARAKVALMLFAVLGNDAHMLKLH